MEKAFFRSRTAGCASLQMMTTITVSLPIMIVRKLRIMAAEFTLQSRPFVKPQVACPSYNAIIFTNVAVINIPLKGNTPTNVYFELIENDPTEHTHLGKAIKMTHPHSRLRRADHPAILRTMRDHLSDFGSASAIDDLLQGLSAQIAHQ